MEPSLVIGIIGGIIVLLLLFGTPLKLFRFFGQSIIKILIGALLLFFLMRSAVISVSMYLSI